MGVQGDRRIANANPYLKRKRKRVIAQSGCIIETRYPEGWGGTGVVHTANGNDDTTAWIETANAIEELEHWWRRKTPRMLPV